MSGKLDQSLDEILSTQRRNANKRRSTRRTSVGNRPAPTAPAGGVQKKPQPGRNGTKQTPAKAGGLVGESKIMVSNLPKDVSEGQIKEYFQSSVGQVKKVDLSYGPKGESRGIAQVTFHHADGASKAFTKLNGLLIDNRPVKVEVLVANADLIPQPKTLAQRIAAPKVQPKSAAAVKPAKGAAAAKKGKKGSVKAKSARPSKKTAQELDSEMADYFVGANNDTATAAAPAAPTGGDAPMEDEIL